MTEELRLWSIGDSGEVEPLKPLQQMPTELELEELLVRNPEMLEPGLKLVGRQTPTQAGWLDLLAVDKDGRLVVYELKRGLLIQDAVTQVLAYASDLDAMNTSQLAAHIADRSGSHGIAESPTSTNGTWTTSAVTTCRVFCRRAWYWSDWAWIPLPNGSRGSFPAGQWTSP